MTIETRSIEERENTKRKALDSVTELERKDWGYWVKKNTDQVELVGRAAQLMKSFSKGAADVVRAVAKRGKLPPDYLFPHVSISKNLGVNASYKYGVQIESGRPTRITMSNIEVDVQGLINLAQNNPLTHYTLERKNPDGSTIETSVGTPDEIAYTTGAEEAAHSIFLYQDFANKRFRPNTFKGSDNPDLAEYDTQPMEYHGRGWQVRAILDQKSDGKLTLDQAKILTKPFIDRIRAAAKLRREKQKS